MIEEYSAFEFTKNSKPDSTIKHVFRRDTYKLFT